MTIIAAISSKVAAIPASRDNPSENATKDRIMGERIMRLLVELNKLGTTVIVATHDLNLVRRMRKSILRLKDGRLTLHGPLKDPAEARKAQAGAGTANPQGAMRGHG